MTDAHTRFRVGLLGPLQIDCVGRRVEPGPAKQRAVFCLLALRLGDSVPVGELEEALWGPAVPATARSLVHTYVARLRQLLEPEHPPRRRVRVIASTVSGYVLRAESVDTDLARFHRYVARAEERLGANAHAEAFELLGQALRLWRDPALGELRALLNDNVEVEALRARWVAAARTYVALALRLRHAAAALDTATRLARLEPLHEAIQADYLAVLDSTGQRAVALGRYDEVSRRLRVELGVDPGIELQSVRRTLARPSGGPPTATATRRWPGCRPVNGRLHWRRDDLAELMGLLTHRRMVTVTGPPGCGKSAVTLRAADQAAAAFTDGVVVVDTHDLSDRRQLERRLARMLGGDGVEDPVELLRARRALVVLDDTEHLVDAVWMVTDRLLRRCPDVVVLASSRQPLGLPYEAVQRLSPLPVPQPGPWPAVARNPAVVLLAERAAWARPGFRLNPGNAATAVEICRRLDGLPLAVEMAAACLAVDTLNGVLRRLDGPLAEVRPPHGEREFRHPSLRAMLDRSIERLDVAEWRLFQRIALLPGDFDLAAAERVWRPHPSGPADVRVVLGSLLDRSLVMPVGQDGERYRMLNLMRRIALEGRRPVAPPVAPAPAWMSPPQPRDPLALGCSMP